MDGLCLSILYTSALAMEDGPQPATSKLTLEMLESFAESNMCN